MELTRNFVEQYNVNNPNATVEDLLKDFKSAVEKEKQKEIDNEEKRRQFYKNLVGHCYRIKLSPHIFLYVNVDKEIEFRGLFAANISGISIQYEPNTSISIETNRKVNLIWFNNPYAESSNTTECVEISQAEYDNVVKLFNDTQNMFKNAL